MIPAGRRRWHWVFVVSWTVLAVQLPAVPAQAHALLQSSQPSNGSTVDEAPSRVTLVFSEEPDPKLSSIRVLDRSGSQMHRGGPAAVGERPGLSVDLSSLSKGVYTVSWRVLSKVDGHLTSGAFSFGVGVKPAPLEEKAEVAGRSVTGVAGRLLFYLGVLGLLGLGAVSTWVKPAAPPRKWLLLFAGLGSGGAALLGAGQLFDSAVSLEGFLSTSLGRGVLLRLAPLLAVAALSFWPTIRWGLVAAAAAAMAMGVHASFGHAAAGQMAVGKMAVQWVHMTAVGIWIGGLFALLLGIRGEAGPEKAAAVRRFSKLAGFALLAVAVTGTLRAWAEVGEFSELFSAPYGRLVAVKVGLLVLLAVLGAINRYRSVPKAQASLSPLRRIGRIEIAAALVALAVAAVLATTVPATDLAAGNRQLEGPIVATASDFGTTMRVDLEVNPGGVGSNRFQVSVRDFDSRKALQAEGVTLRFDFITDPAVGESSLALKKSGDGVFTGSGSQLSLEGRWRVSALVEKGQDSTEVRFDLSTVPEGQSTEVDSGAQPAIHNLRRPSGESLQLYLDPQRPGKGELHATFFDAKGNETPIEEAIVIADPGEARSRSLSLRRFGPGHFVADLRLVEGNWTFDIVGRRGGAASLRYLGQIQVE